MRIHNFLLSVGEIGRRLMSRYYLMLTAVFPGGRGYRLIHQSGPSKFILSHCNHMVNVEYDCTGWLQAARDTTASRYAKTIVAESNR